MTCCWPTGRRRKAIATTATAGCSETRTCSWDAAPQPSCAPILTGGAQVDRALAHDCSTAPGPRPGLPLTPDPDLHLLVNGKRLDAIERRDDAYLFRLLVAAAFRTRLFAFRRSAGARRLNA